MAGRVDLRVVDHGPGLRRDERERVLSSPPGLGDTDFRHGVGLGLALTRGFVDAVGGELDLEDTPGGGCTAVVRLAAPSTPTPSIIDADIDADVLFGDESTVDAPADASAGPDTTI